MILPAVGPLPPAAVAAACAAAAVVLLLPVRPRVADERQPAGLPTWPAVAVLGLGVLPVVVLTGRLTVLALIAAAAGLAAHRLVVVRRRRREAQRVAGRVLEACEHLAAELTSGQPPGAALERAADELDVLAPVAQAFRMGADVPAAFREAAGRPGAEQLRHVGAAWQVAHGAGHGLADAVDRVATELRAAQGTRRIVEGELASARATARLVAALPVLSLLMGSGSGGDPWGFLLGHPVGLACLAGGLAFGFAGLWWIEAIARDVDRQP